MSETFGSPANILQELMIVGYLCGYPHTPNVYSAYDIIKQCISIEGSFEEGGKHVTVRYGYGLALYTLTLVLSGGEIPFHAVMPVPFGSLGRIRNMCVIEGKRLHTEGIIDREGFFITFGTEIDRTINRQVRTPNAFAVCLEYDDMEGRLNKRCFMISVTMNPSYPYTSSIATDAVTERLIEICREGKTELTGEEYHEYMRKFGEPISKEYTQAGEWEPETEEWEEE